MIPLVTVTIGFTKFTDLYVSAINGIYIYTLWLFIIAMENGPFIDVF
jgi:hypothetical protein